MTKRARIIDKNPLSPTDRVLDSFQQVSQPEIQQPNKSTTQSTGSTELEFPLDAIDLGQPEEPPSLPEPDPLPDRSVGKSKSQQVGKSRSQPAKLSAKAADTATQDSQLAVKRATFQISVEVLEQLDRFHLQLQLELGKANTPYKEVMVEEAIAQLLERAEQNQSKLIAALQRRQQLRD